MKSVVADSMLVDNLSTTTCRVFFFFSSRRRHTRCSRDWSSDVCSSDLHPDFQGLEFDLSAERAVVVGAGNVALDVARMLALTRAELSPTDTTDRAIDAIAESGLREIVVLGRRGPAQAAFTTPELKELGELAGADVVVDPTELELDSASLGSLEGNTNATRNMEVLREFASREPTGKPRRVVLRFLVSPVAIVGEDAVEGVEVVHNELVADGGRISARATDRRETIPAGLVFRSVGYRGVALPGLPFDPARGTLLNDGGRVLDGSGTPLAGVYCAGWIKRGPTGVIGTNKKDATETVQDRKSTRLNSSHGYISYAVFC